MAVKVTNGQICDGSISKNICDKEHNLCGKFYNCITKCKKCSFFGAMPLYTISGVVHERIAGLL